MQRNERACKESLVFLLEWKRESIDDRAENLEQLRNAVMSFGVVDELEEDIGDGPTNEST